MLLEKLEIKGFKSFGDKITINFNEGITGIVGPNGCGKSNIVDAIRWVLGEQRTRALRSEKMENIIFNGTKKRKPLQLAEVSLSFSNTRNILPTEYSNVTVTRRYYRSGEGEYELNGVRCRLKDITNLFLDTGITANSYAIIELAMVDDLLNDKDNSRRALFEEAAGISKFKKRKKETLRRIEDTDADLERVDDLLFEIEKNLKSLEKQARQTRKYYKLKDEYKVFSIGLGRRNLQEHNEKFERINKQIESENDKKVELNKQVAQVEASIAIQKKKLIEKEKHLAQCQRDLNDHVSKIRQYESDKQIKNERLKFLNDKSESLRDQITQDRKSHERASFSLDSLANEKAEAEKLYIEAKSKLDNLSESKTDQETKTIRLQEELNALDSMVKSRREQVYQHNKSLEIKEIQIASLKNQLEKTSSDTSEQSESLLLFEKKNQELEKLMAGKKASYEKMKEKEATARKRIADMEKTLEVIRDEVNQISRKLDARRNEYNLTRSLVDNLEGFPEAIKFLKKESGWGKNAPLLSDIISCSEEYKVTIENFLETFMNYYIVDSEAEAYKAVNLLSEASKGRAHFFVLNRFEKFHPQSSKIYSNAFPATEVVEFDQKYRKLVSHILDGVYIVENDSDIPKDNDSIFVSKNGKVTSRRFSLSGGSVGLFEGKKIGRAKNLEKLDKEIRSLNKQLEKVQSSYEEKEAELSRLKEATRQQNLEEIQLEVNQLNEELVSVKTKQEQYSDLLSNADLKREDLVSGIDQLQSEIKALRPATDRLLKELSKSDEQLQALNTTLEAEKHVLEEKKASLNQENIFFHQQENKVQSLEQEIGYKKTTLENTRERIERNSTDLTKTEGEIKQLVSTAQSSDQDLVKMYDKKEGIERSLNDAEKDYYEQRGSIDEAEKQVREIQRRRESLDNIILELHDGLNGVKIELTAIRERLSAEFSIDIEDLSQTASHEDDPTKEMDLNELAEKVNKIRARLESMGPVNPMAMEAYGEIQERHEFITSQKEDLIQARESLMTTIEEIDLVARATFMEAFEKIKSNFIGVFRSLFADQDDCDLLLIQPENPLESAIEIMAKPKGKKPISINQLSGGEKTLTATALLFAIYLLKPAPFCVFDEVDAPLDDANIDKFNQIIHKFAEESQFIIVTHNKRTMTRTDVIYGITMAEQGVSKVVPVDLRQLA